MDLSNGKKVTIVTKIMAYPRSLTTNIPITSIRAFF